MGDTSKLNRVENFAWFAIIVKKYRSWSTKQLEKTWSNYSLHLISFISNDLFSCMVCFPKFLRVVAYFLSKFLDSCCLAQQLFRAILRVFLWHYMFFCTYSRKIYICLNGIYHSHGFSMHIHQ